MRYPHFRWFIHLSLLLALAVSGCGDVSVNLDDQPDNTSSPLRLSQPASSLTLSWTPVKDVTQYRVLQTDSGVEVIPGKVQIVTDDNIYVLDVSEYGPAVLSKLEIAVEANDPKDGWKKIEYGQIGQRSPRELQFDWDPVEGATQYRLTQTAGSYPLLPLPQQQIIYSVDQTYDRFIVPLHLFDWAESRFTLEAQVAGEWTFVGENATGNVLTELLIGRFGEVDPFTAQVATQLAFGWSIALSENGAMLAAGAIGETSVPVEQRNCPEAEPNCDKNKLLVLARNAGAVYTYASLSTEAQIVKAPNTDAEDLFGRAVALSADGTTLVVSAMTEDSDVTGVHPLFDPLLDSEDADNSGAAYVYVRAADTWTLQAYIKAPNTDAGDLFGWDLSLSADGNTLAIGAVAEDSAGNDLQDDSKGNSGAVYVYSRTDGLWSQSAYLKASNADENDSFGSAVAINKAGDYLAIAAVGESGSAGNPLDNSKPNAGAVYVFARNAGNLWSQVAYLKASNASAGDFFGQSLSFSANGSLLAVGAPQEDRLINGIVPVDSGTESLNTGAVYLYARSGDGLSSAFSQKGFYFKPSNPSQNIQFGQAVSLSSSGNTLAVGAWGERSSAVGIGGNQDGEAVPGAGAAYVFKRTPDSDSWEQVNYVKPSDQVTYLYFGSKLALANDGQLLAVSGNGVRPDSGITGFPGFVYLY